MSRIVDEDLDAAVLEGIVTALSDAGGQAGLPPLSWEVDSQFELTFEGRHSEGRAHPDAGRLCAQWADALGLIAQGEDHDNTCRYWSRSAAYFTIAVFAITDPARYRALYPGDAELDL